MQTVHRSTDFDHHYFDRNRSDSLCAGFTMGLHNNNATINLCFIYHLYAQITEYIKKSILHIQLNCTTISAANNSN